MNKRNFNLLLITGLAVLGLVFVVSATVRAQQSAETIVLATVNIYDAKIDSQSGNNIKISFDLNNRTGIQPGVKYAVDLLKREGENLFLIDQKVYNNDVMDLGINETFHKEITYSVPSFLSGAYEIWVESKNDNGLPLAQARAGEITLKGSGDYIEIIPSSCYITISGDESNTKYTLGQGVDIAPNESLLGHCTFKNHSVGSIKAIPVFTTYYRTTFGETISVVKGNEVSLQKNESKLANFSLPKTDKPQAYDVALILYDSQSNFNSFSGQKQLSNLIVFHYVLQGASATIQNLRLDKDYYQKGDTAKVSFTWTASADSFVGSRAGSNLSQKVNAEITLSNAEGKTCTKEVLQKELDNSDVEFNVPINANCLNPQVVVLLKDSNGNILDQTTFTVESKNIKAAPKLGIILLVIIAAVAIMGLFLSLLLKRKKKGIIVPIIFLPFVIGLGCCPALTKAATFKVYYQYHPALGAGCGLENYLGATFSVNIDKNNYSSGEPIQATGSGDDTLCSNNTNHLALYANINGANYTLFDQSLSGGSILFGSATGYAQTPPGNYNAHFTGKFCSKTDCSATTSGGVSCSRCLLWIRGYSIFSFLHRHLLVSRSVNRLFWNNIHPNQQLRKYANGYWHKKLYSADLFSLIFSLFNYGRPKFHCYLEFVK